MCKMSVDEFKNRVDGCVNDFVNFVCCGEKFRSDIMDIMIKVMARYLDHNSQDNIESTNPTHNTGMLQLQIDCCVCGRAIGLSNIRCVDCDREQQQHA